MICLDKPWRRRIGAMATSVVLLVLGGCGAGVVGTGSGKGVDGGAKTGIAFTPLGICTAPFAESSLACSTDSTDPLRGTAPVQWLDVPSADRAALVFAHPDGNGIGVEYPCLGLAFLGQWGELDDGTRGFVGSYVDNTSKESRPAVAYVLPDPAQPEAVGWLQMMDTSGTTLLGPTLLHHAEGELNAADCTS